MGKARAKEAKMRGARKARLSGGANDNLLRNSVGKISAEISAISLGPPRSKILKKSGSSSGGRGDPTNITSRGGGGESARAKKKVTFSHNLIAEELKHDGHQDDVKRLFRVVHPAAMRRAANSGGDGSRSASEHTFMTDKNVTGIRKLLKDSIKGKRMRIRARRDVFRKKMELVKQTEVESRKAKQREQTVIVGDMHPLLQALPSLSDDLGATDLQETDAGKLDQRKTTKKHNNKFSVKKTRQAILDSLKLFEASGVTTAAHHRISKN